MEKWEYKALELSHHSRRDCWFAKINGNDVFGLTECLDLFGNYGWELVNTFLRNDMTLSLTAVFKRKKG